LGNENRDAVGQDQAKRFTAAFPRRCSPNIHVYVECWPDTASPYPREQTCLCGKSTVILDPRDKLVAPPDNMAKSSPKNQKAPPEGGAER